MASGSGPPNSTLISPSKALLINKLYNHCASFCSGQGVANGGVPERYVPFATPRPRTKTGATQGAPSLLPFRCVPVEGTYASYARFDRALRIRQNRPRGCKVYLLAAPKPISHGLRVIILSRSFPEEQSEPLPKVASLSAVCPAVCRAV